MRARVPSLVIVLVLAWALPSATAIAPSTELATLLSDRVVYATPDVEGRRVATVSDERPLTDERTTLPVIGREEDDAGRGWLRVRLPGRVLGRTPPPRTGWIQEEGTFPSATPWRIVIDRRTRRVHVYERGIRARSLGAVVGKRSTPTPVGEYFVEESIRLSDRASGAPFALATSARSSVLQEFEGGPGQIAIHGRDNVGGRLGSAVSHGCIRVSTSSIGWLAERIEPGTPVTIR